MRDVRNVDDPRYDVESAGFDQILDHAAVRRAAEHLPVAAHAIGHDATVPDDGRETAYDPDDRVAQAVPPREQA